MSLTPETVIRETDLIDRALVYDTPQTDEELWIWVKEVLNISIPRQSVCPECAAPFTAFADAYFARSPVIVWEASRGFGGKSFLLATLALTEQITLGAAISLLGGSGEQSQRIHQYLSGEDPNATGRFWDAPRAPTELLTTDPTKVQTRTNNGGYIKALMASQTSVRGPHPNRLRFDEVDEADEKILDASLGQPMGSRGVSAQTVISSTHQHPTGTMAEVKRRAAERGWPVHEWCYRENLESNGGWLPQAEVERKKIEVPQAMWQIEYENQEPSVEGRAIDADAVERLFDRRLGVYAGEEGREIVIVEPGDGREFYHGADWAKRQDYTFLESFVRMEEGPDVLAAWQRMQRRPWPKMIGAFNDRVERYGGVAYHDITGIGDVVHDYLNVDSRGWDFRKRKDTHELLSAYIAAIENGELVMPRIDHSYRSHKYADLDMIYGSKHLPDDIAAGALAWKARRRKRSNKRPMAAML